MTFVFVVWMTVMKVNVFMGANACYRKETEQLVESWTPRRPPAPPWMWRILVCLALLTSESKVIHLKLCITFYLAQLPHKSVYSLFAPVQSLLNKFQLSKTAIQHA